jgi:hypothetical protein
MKVALLMRPVVIDTFGAHDARAALVAPALFP